MTEVKKHINDIGTIFWYKVGTAILHREDGPAIEYANGDKAWYKEGKEHREDGSAIEWSNGYKEYWYEGIYYDVSNLDEFYIKRILE